MVSPNFLKNKNQIQLENLFKKVIDKYASDGESHTGKFTSENKNFSMFISDDFLYVESKSPQFLEHFHIGDDGSGLTKMSSYPYYPEKDIKEVRLFEAYKAVKPYFKEKFKEGKALEHKRLENEKETEKARMGEVCNILNINSPDDVAYVLENKEWFNPVTSPEDDLDHYGLPMNLPRCSREKAEEILRVINTEILWDGAAKIEDYSDSRFAMIVDKEIVRALRCAVISNDFSPLYELAKDRGIEVDRENEEL